MAKLKPNFKIGDRVIYHDNDMQGYYATIVELQKVNGAFLINLFARIRNDEATFYDNFLRDNVLFTIEIDGLEGQHYATPKSLTLL